MKMGNRKWIAALLALVLALATTACTGAPSSAGADTPAAAGSETPASESAAPAETQSESAAPAETQSESAAPTPSETPDETPKGDGYAKFSQLEMGMTESDVNGILGEPVRVDKAYYYYNVTVNGQDMEIEVWINTTSGLVIYKNGDFYKGEYRAEFADSATDFSTVDDLENGKLQTYEDCAAAFKTPGYVITDDEDGVKRYLWVDANDGYMCVTFKADGSVKTYSGFC